MRKRCIRRVWAKIDPIKYVIDGVQITPESALAHTRLRELAAIEAFRTGVATLQEWADANAMLSLCETMARGGIGPEALDACERTEAALIDAASRYERTGKMGIDGPGLRALRDLYEYHDIQRTSISRGEYERWIKKTRDMIRSGGKHVKVIG